MCGYSHVEVCNDAVKHLMQNSSDLRPNVILEGINGFGVVYRPCLLDIPTESNPKRIDQENAQTKGGPYEER